MGSFSSKTIKLAIVGFPAIFQLVCYMVFINVGDYRQPCSSTNNNCFCESNSNNISIIHQPSNTNTCIFYIVAGLLNSYYYYFYYYDFKWTHKVDIVLIPSLTCLVGLMSMFYHAYTTTWASKMDGFGMYSYGTYMMGIILARLITSRAKKNIVNYVTVQYATSTLLFILFVLLDFLTSDDVRDYTFGGFIIVFCILGLMNYVYLIIILLEPNLMLKLCYPISMTCLVIGFIFYTIEPYVYCYPTSFYQNHSMWHFFTALAFFFLNMDYFITQNYFNVFDGSNKTLHNKKNGNVHSVGGGWNEVTKSFI